MAKLNISNAGLQRRRSPPPSVPSGLVAWYKLEDTLGTAMVGPSITPNGSLGVGSAKFGNGVGCEGGGGGSYFDFNPVGVVSPLKGCVEAWVKILRIPGANSLGVEFLGFINGRFLSNGDITFCFDQYAGPQHINATVWFDGGANYAFVNNGINGGVFDGQGIQPPTPLLEGSIHHFALSWDKNGIESTTHTVSLFLDGVEIGYSTGSWGTNITGNWQLIGNAGTYGIMDEFEQITSEPGFYMDNMKFWDYAKTDFSDRFVEDGVTTMPTGLSFWSKLGSASDITAPMVGSGASVVGSPVFGPGKYWNAIKGSSTSGFSLPRYTYFPDGQNWSYSVWIRISNTVYDGMSIFNDVGNYGPTLFCGNSNNLVAYINGNPPVGGAIQDFTIPLGEWFHFAIVHNYTSNYMKAFINGAEHNITHDYTQYPQDAGTSVSYPNWYFQTSNLAGANTNVEVDNLQIWNFAKTSFPEIMYEHPGDASSENSLIFWSKLGSNGDLSSPNIGRVPLFKIGSPSYPTGQFGNALQIDAQSNYFLLSPSYLTNKTKWTMEFWMYVPDVTTYSKIFAEGTNNTYWYFYYGIDFGNRFSWDDAYYDGTNHGTGWVVNFDKSSLSNGWNHMAVVFDANGIGGNTSKIVSMYGNGSELPVGSSGDTRQFFSNDPRNYNLTRRFGFGGPYNDTNTTSGTKIDNLKIWNYAKTDFSDRNTEG